MAILPLPAVGRGKELVELILLLLIVALENLEKIFTKIKFHARKSAICARLQHLMIIRVSES